MRCGIRIWRSSSSPTLRARVRAEAAHVARSLTTFGPARGRRWPLALQAGLAMAVPIVVLAASGHASIALLAATGAFTVIYGGWLRPRERARFAPLVALALATCAAAGTLAAAGGTIAALIGVLVVTILSAAVAGWISLGPPGPVFFVLVFGLSAQVTSVHAGGQRAVDPWVYLALVAASSVFACLLVVAPLALPRYRREPVRPLRELFPRRWGAIARTLTVRAAIVGVVGVAAAAVLDPERSYWIVCAGIAVVGLPVGRRDAAVRGIHRTVGTVVGAAAYLALAFLPLPVWALGLVLGGLQFVIELVVVRHYALALVFITPLVLLIIGAATGDSASLPLALERVVDTLVGAAVGTVAALAVRLRAD
ncbi:MAG: FUSC family protein [Microbacterium sp.]|uniref:FUSC family protein n=1 Tax=Microbacterium sp. TaxID=51671 RepID=UPI0019CC74B8|nr:FUSC family protein [Microbacterium sp.]MBD3757668.1 FUSC family protein [Microbacterium sp.]